MNKRGRREALMERRRGPKPLKTREQWIAEMQEQWNQIKEYKEINPESVRIAKELGLK